LDLSLFRSQVRLHSRRSEQRGSAHFQISLIASLKAFLADRFTIPYSKKKFFFLSLSLSLALFGNVAFYHYARHDLPEWRDSNSCGAQAIY
jgi:hypothetical protein